MGNVIIMYFLIVLDIVLGESSFKITLRFLVFYSFGIRIWENPSCKPPLDTSLL